MRFIRITWPNTEELYESKLNIIRVEGLVAGMEQENGGYGKRRDCLPLVFISTG